jgi:hypothetical protein
MTRLGGKPRNLRFFEVIITNGLQPAGYLSEHPQDVGTAQSAGIKLAHMIQGLDRDRVSLAFAGARLGRRAGKPRSAGRRRVAKSTAA